MSGIGRQVNLFALMRHGRQPHHLPVEAEGYPWIGRECCKGTVWVPFKMIRNKSPA
jgi:hypothetical protein